MKMISIASEITCVDTGSKKLCITIRAFINVEITNFCKCLVEGYSHLKKTRVERIVDMMVERSEV
ncbi:hypothetical protein HanRHA438_Chr15g0721891 [Helianthus annuus]|nr:hypothetical protein HanRHA438_Chr15g0721891 [Helianthus annuus]